MKVMDCIPDESIYTVEEFKAAKKAMLSGTREVQYADKRVVYRNMTEIGDILRAMQEAIWGHCDQYKSALGRKIYVTSSKGIC